MTKVICIDIYDKDGMLTKIEVTDRSGEFIMQFLWDEHDEQTSENRIKFREWAYRHLRQNNYDL